MGYYKYRWGQWIFNIVYTDLVVFVFEHVFRIAYGVNTYIAQAYSNTYIHVAVFFEHVWKRECEDTRTYKQTDFSFDLKQIEPR